MRLLAAGDFASDFFPANTKVVFGVRVPAILISPFVARGTVIPGTEDPVHGRVFEHASIPASVSKHFMNGTDEGTVREQSAETFLDLLGDAERPDNDCVFFNLKG
jgi:phospholipase C